MKKTKILIIGAEQFLQETMLEPELKALKAEYEVLFADNATDALDKIAKAKLLEKNPIYGLVFQRNTLVCNRERCGLVAKFAESYSDQLVTSINMLWNEQDTDARNAAVSADYCESDDWKKVKDIFDARFKK
ncbi:TPA: hypothetical protein DCZ39_00290 [Patescibacteria group bacterium]|nr:hypothetical protein [Candidatus Gracilibacteria bacterium]